ncbi:Ger(x)C family spore germination C-terminal domain-containing protein [Clostridium hydrogeniformans]|uniref:Ger(x)C family spore germination C-terminal domain-containing protein n=1 Tax=Clostridium hydrogeniformans TaxID=349933 RepID=UPI0004844334|nr:Ger(x)C family spore germination C-terminal domain-containing protein [Clostridium hydrogeniformans]
MGMKNKKLLTIFIISICVYTFLVYKKVNVPIEDLTIPSLTALDIEKQGDEEVFLIENTTYTYKKNEPKKKLNPTASGVTLGKARENYDLTSKGTILPGLQKAILFGTKLSETGLNKCMDLFFSTRSYTDLCQCAITRANGKDVSELNLSGDIDIADFIEGMLKSSYYGTFFSENYRLIDIYASLSSEGRNLVLPYIDIKNNSPYIVGLALFKGDKVVKYLDVDDSKTMNILRENNLGGIISFKESNEESIDCAVKSYRKVKYSKDSDGKFHFTINVSMIGDVILNSMYDNLSKSPEKIKEVEHKLEDTIRKQCYSFIEDMQMKYKVDCLELGRYVIAKEGRGKDIDWNDIVCKSRIDVNIKVSLETFGRGEF